MAVIVTIISLHLRLVSSLLAMAIGTSDDLCVSWRNKYVHNVCYF